MTKASDNLFPGLIIRESADDGSDFSNPSADYRRLFVGEDGDIHLKDSSGTVTDFPAGGGGGGGGGLLGVASYAPGSDTTIGTASSTTLVDVDATNLDVTFTAPSSGNVVVKLYALCGPTSGGGQQVRWGVRESTSIVGGPVLVDPAGATAARYLAASIYIAGIAGGSHTYKFAYAQSANTVAIYGGPTYGKAVIEVWEAP